MQSIKERFGRESDGMFLEAKRATVASQSVIPPWFIVLTFALGWNELLTILRNPMLTISFVIAMSVSFFVWKTNMGGPAFQIAKATAFEAASQTKVFFKDKGLDVDRLKDLTNNITTTLNQVHTPKKTEQIELKELNETDKNK
jgi:hypothetical protein